MSLGDHYRRAMTIDNPVGFEDLKTIIFIFVVIFIIGVILMSKGE